MDNIASALQSLEARRNELKQEWESVDRVIEHLKTMGTSGELSGNGSQTSKQIQPRQFLGMKCADAMQQFLLTVGPATEEAITHGLIDGGRDMGRYPYRTTSVCISINKGRFERKGDLVHVIHPPRPQPRPTPKRRSASR